MSLEHAREFLQQLGADFEYLPTREDQLLAFREYGERLAPMDEALKTDANFVHGCASATHVAAQPQDDGTLRFAGASLSLISRGYLWILIEAFDGATPQEILTEAEPLIAQFAEQGKVHVTLVPSRVNAFERIFRHMQKQAAALLTAETVAAEES